MAAGIARMGLLARIAHRASFQAVNILNLCRPEGRPCARLCFVPVGSLAQGFPTLPARTADANRQRGGSRRGLRPGPDAVPYLGRAAEAKPPA